MNETTDTAEFRVPTAVPKGRVRVDGARLKEAALALAVVAGIAGAAEYGDDYWTTGRFLVTTDDAYVDAHSVLISPKVSGYNRSRSTRRSSRRPRGRWRSSERPGTSPSSISATRRSPRPSTARSACAPLRSGSTSSRALS